MQISELGFSKSGGKNAKETKDALEKLTNIGNWKDISSLEESCAPFQRGNVEIATKFKVTSVNAQLLSKGFLEGRELVSQMC